MADLAKLVVRLEAQSAQLLTELEKANSKIGRFERTAGSSLDRLNKRFDKFGFGVKASLGALLGGISFSKLIDANNQAAKTFANLENAVERAGDAAGGRSAKDFADTAKQMANLTTQTGGAVQGVQQLLLRFQNIRTDRFDEATKRVLDFSAALGGDLQSAATLVGKALADPIKGVTALAKAGVNFSEGQKDVIKTLVETGRRAEAQGLILDKLEEKFGAAAEKARNNFGGALVGVKNALDDLLEQDGGLPEATDQLNKLATILQDPAVKQGADQLFALLINGAAKAARFIGETAAGIGVLFNAGGDRVQQLTQQIEFLKKERASFLPFVTNVGGKSDIFPGGGFLSEVLTPREIDEKIEELTNLQNKILGLGEAGIETARNVQKSFTDISGAFELPDIEVIDGLTDAEKKLAEQAEKAGKALTESLQTPMERMGSEIKKADDLLRANVISFETWQRAVRKAAEDVDPLLGAIANLNGEVRDLGEGLREKLLNEDAGIDVEGQVNDSTDAELDQLDKAREAAARKSQVFAEQAARNTQDILADGIETALEDGFDKGAEGALEAFGKMLERMAIQAIAADLASKLFGDGSTAGGISGGNGGALGGIISAAGDFIGELFGAIPARDSGGRGRAGQPVAIGRRAQPELFVPDSAGEFFPAGAWPGSGRAQKLTQNIYTTAPITQRSARQLSIEAARQQRTATARLG